MRDNEWIHDINVAEQLLYPNSVITALKDEPDSAERQMILRVARHNAINRGVRSNY